MQRKNLMVLLCTAAIFGILLFYAFMEYEAVQYEKEKQAGGLKGGDPETDGSLSSVKPGSQSGEGSGEGSGDGSSSAGGGTQGSGTGSGSGSPSEGQTVPEGLPADFYSRSCGFYYERYKQCGGTCPSGKCVNEGRSCYCKEA